VGRQLTGRAAVPAREVDRNDESPFDLALGRRRPGDGRRGGEPPDRLADEEVADSDVGLDHLRLSFLYDK
jgi:hypothetical protein